MMKYISCLLAVVCFLDKVAAQVPSVLKDIFNYTAIGSITGAADYTQVGSTVFFTATDCNTGFELWKTDGTAGGLAGSFGKAMVQVQAL